MAPIFRIGTVVGGRSFMMHVRHSATAIASGLCKTVLITHGESGRSGVGRTRSVVSPASLAGQFEQPYGRMGPPTLFTIPELRYMKTYGLTSHRRGLSHGAGSIGKIGRGKPASGDHRHKCNIIAGRDAFHVAAAAARSGR
jgi:hypothetical protein